MNNHQDLLEWRVLCRVQLIMQKRFLLGVCRGGELDLSKLDTRLVEEE
jgi:hypothetical protein